MNNFYLINNSKEYIKYLSKFELILLTHHFYNNANVIDYNKITSSITKILLVYNYYYYMSLTLYIIKNYICNDKIENVDLLNIYKTLFDYISEFKSKYNDIITNDNIEIYLNAMNNLEIDISTLNDNDMIIFNREYLSNINYFIYNNSIINKLTLPIMFVGINTISQYIKFNPNFKLAYLKTNCDNILNKITQINDKDNITSFLLFSNTIFKNNDQSPYIIQPKQHYSITNNFLNRILVLSDLILINYNLKQLNKVDNKNVHFIEKAESAKNNLKSLHSEYFSLDNINAFKSFITRISTKSKTVNLPKNVLDYNTVINRYVHPIKYAINQSENIYKPFFTLCNSIDAQPYKNQNILYIHCLIHATILSKYIILSLPTAQYPKNDIIFIKKLHIMIKTYRTQIYDINEYFDLL
jgi:hypothetical protein